MEKSNETLKHLTSGLFFPLQHGVIKEDLRFSKYLWQRSELNPANNSNSTNKKSYRDVMKKMCCQPSDSRPDIHGEFNTWIFLRDLIQNIKGFEYLHSEIGEPEVLEQIPVVKTNIYPAYAMDVNNSTVSGNI